MPGHKNRLFAIEDFLEKSDHSNEFTNNDTYTPMGDVYFAFIDVLGFKRAFNESQKLQEDIVTPYEKVFIHYFALMDAAHFLNNPTDYAGQTSDSLYFYTSKIDTLFQFLKIFSYFNSFSMEEGVFFRGGIAKGSLFRKEPFQFYGESVTRAYLLESEISRFPIISIDNTTAKELFEQDKDLYKILVKSKENRYYLNPFTYLFNQFRLPIDETIIRCPDKGIITENIKINKETFEFDSKNYKKYTFLNAEYKEENEYQMKNSVK